MLSGNEAPQPEPPAGDAGAESRRRGFVAVAGIAVIILGLGLLTYNGLRHLQTSRAWVDHTERVLASAEDVHDDILDAETGQRGFMMVGEEEYLAPYHRALAALASDTAKLRALTRDNPQQQARLNRLAPLIREKLSELDQTITSRRKNGLEAMQPLLRSNRGKNVMDSIRTELAGIEAGERSLLAERTSNESRYSSKANWIVLVGTLLAITFSFFLARMLARNAELQARSARELAARNSELAEQALELRHQRKQLEEQTEALIERNEALRASSESLLRQSESLDAARIAAQSAQAEAENANRAKLQFLATMSHELRTPLNAISGYADLLTLGVRGPVTPSQVDDLNRIKRASQTLLSHINDILNFAKLEAGRIEFLSGEVPVKGLIHSSESLVRPQLLSKGIAFDQSCDDGITVVGDREKIEQILLNLLSNSQKFTAPNGVITVTCEASGKFVSIAVRDTGIGIPPDKLESIFEPFVQVNRQLNTGVHQGVGLGLAISRELARAMGGDIVASSVRGKGSEFTLTLPQGGRAV